MRLNDMTETTGLVFLGLTIGCARCHDHKFDPIRQTDFYALQAFFAPARFRDDYPLARPASGRGKLERHRRDGPQRAADYLLRRGVMWRKGPRSRAAFPAVLLREDHAAASTPRRRAGRPAGARPWPIGCFSRLIR